MQFTKKGYGVVILDHFYKSNQECNVYVSVNKQLVSSENLVSLLCLGFAKERVIKLFHSKCLRGKHNVSRTTC